jgi:hypothetical protein
MAVIYENCFVAHTYVLPAPKHTLSVIAMACPKVEQSDRKKLGNVLDFVPSIEDRKIQNDAILVPLELRAEVIPAVGLSGSSLSIHDELREVTQRFQVYSDRFPIWNGKA